MVKSLVSDDTLVHEYIQGNERVLSTIIQRHKSKVFRHIARVVKDDDLAQDVFQETFIKVIHLLKENQYQGEGKFIHWLLRVAHNMALDTLRYKKRAQPIEYKIEEPEYADVLMDSGQNAEDQLIHKQTNKGIKQLIYKLPLDQREVILLRHYSGLTFKEIAEETNVSINTALGRMRYGLINLRKMIEDQKLDFLS